MRLSYIFSGLGDQTQYAFTLGKRVKNPGMQKARWIVKQNQVFLGPGMRMNGPSI